MSDTYGGNAIDTETDDGWVEGGEDAYLDSSYEDRYESFGDYDPYDYACSNYGEDGDFEDE